MKGLKSTKSGGAERRGHQKHLRMKERKKMSLVVLPYSNPDMKSEYWGLIVSTQGRSTQYTATTASTHYR